MALRRLFLILSLRASSSVFFLLPLRSIKSSLLSNPNSRDLLIALSNINCAAVAASTVTFKHCALLKHVALSPIQFQMFLDRRPILPDPYSGRFGLRSDPLKAIERAHYFMNWSAPYAEPPPRTQIKKFRLCTVSFTPIGILTLQQSQILEPGDGTGASRLGYYRYTGPMSDQLSGEYQGATMLYYKFSDEFQELVWTDGDGRF